MMPGISYRMIYYSTIIIVLYLTGRSAFAASNVLNAGNVIERDSAGGQTDTYELALFDGQFIPVTIGQRGIDVVVRWLDPNGQLLLEYDNEFRLNGIEKTELVARKSGNYKLEIEAKYKRDHKGRYEIRVAAPHTATEQEILLSEAAEDYTKSNQFYAHGKLDEAVVPGQQAIAIYEKFIPDSVDLGRSLYNLAVIFHDQSDYEKAKLLYERAIEIQEKILGPNDPELAHSLARYGWFLADEGEIPKAEALYNRALQMDQQILGDNHSETGWILDRLASLAEDKSDYAGSEALCKKALAVLEKSVEPDDPIVAWPLHDLGYVYWRTGDPANAITFFQRALAIREKALGADHPLVSLSAFGLATAYNDIGDYKNAESFHLKALAIRKKVYGPESFRVATSLNNLAFVYGLQDDLDKAAAMYIDALEIFAKIKGQELYMAYPLENLAMIYHKKNDLENAEAYLRRALVIREKILGNDHPRVADILDNLGNIYRTKGEYNSALDLQLRALDIWEKTVGPWYPDNVVALMGIAGDYMAMGDINKALEYQTRAEAIIEHNLTLTLASGPERQRLGYQELLEERTSQTITLNVDFAPESDKASELALTAILQRKGRVLDSLMENITALRSRFTPEDRILLDRLNETTAKLSELVLNGPEEASLSEHQSQIGTLEEEREKLEAEIAERSAGFYQRSTPVSIAEVRSKIPADAALVEFAKYRRFDPKSKRYQTLNEPHYVAYILRSEGNVFWRDLGEAKTIDDHIAAMRSVLQDSHRTDVRTIAQRLEQEIMKPLQPLLADTKLLLISTDGALSLFPFEALVDENGRYFVEQYSFSYLTSGRDLLRLQAKRESKSEPMIIADPLFGEPENAAFTKKLAANSRNRSVTSGSDMASIYFARLSGASQEAQAIKTLFPEANIFTGKQATESTIKFLDAPRILHIATHGFFLTDDASDAITKDTRSIHANVKIENPLLRSGLALANANLHQGSGDDGILTALEVSGLNLWGTKLAVLSACDTGLGQVRNGEGVYGLRRAFVLAGVESLVMSLWSVSDSVTRELMTGYYKGIKQNLGRGEALRQVKLNMLNRKGREHPFYWASFIQLGEWANLEGLR